jgi:hypothetical protein
MHDNNNHKNNIFKKLAGLLHYLAIFYHLSFNIIYCTTCTYRSYSTSGPDLVRLHKFLPLKHKFHLDRKFTNNNLNYTNKTVLPIHNQQFRLTLESITQPKHKTHHKHTTIRTIDEHTHSYKQQLKAVITNQYNTASSVLQPRRQKHNTPVDAIQNRLPRRSHSEAQTQAGRRNIKYYSKQHIDQTKDLFPTTPKTNDSPTNSARRANVRPYHKSTILYFNIPIQFSTILIVVAYRAPNTHKLTANLKSTSGAINNSASSNNINSNRSVNKTPTLCRLTLPDDRATTYQIHKYSNNNTLPNTTQPPALLTSILHRNRLRQLRSYYNNIRLTTLFDIKPEKHNKQHNQKPQLVRIDSKLDRQIFSTNFSSENTIHHRIQYLYRIDSAQTVSPAVPELTKNSYSILLSKHNTSIKHKLKSLGIDVNNTPTFFKKYIVSNQSTYNPYFRIYHKDCLKYKLTNYIQRRNHHKPSGVHLQKNSVQHKLTSGKPQYNYKNKNKYLADHIHTFRPADNNKTHNSHTTKIATYQLVNIQSRSIRIVIFILSTTKPPVTFHLRTKGGQSKNIIPYTDLELNHNDHQYQIIRNITSIVQQTLKHRITRIEQYNIHQPSSQKSGNHNKKLFQNHCRTKSKTNTQTVTFKHYYLRTRHKQSNTIRYNISTHQFVLSENNRIIPHDQ